MTPYKNFSQNSTWPNRIRKGALFLAVSALLAAPGCSSGDNGSDWEEVTVEEPTQGVITTIEETEAGKFTVADEKIAPSRQDSRVIIRRLNGNIDTLTLDQAKHFVGAQDTVRQTQVVNHYHGGGFGLGHILWWSAMGHMMGRSFGSPAPSYVYRDAGAMGRTANELRRTSVSRTVKVPASGRSGFFKSSRSRSGG